MRSEERQCRKKRLLSKRLTSLMVPDPHFDIIPAFLNATRLRIHHFDPDVLVTFCYPFSMHVVGHLIKRSKIIPYWVADYGDPWIGGGVEELRRPKWRKKVDACLERRVLSNCDMVTVTTDAAMQLYAARFQPLRGRLLVVPMGYDPEDFRNLPRIQFAADDAGCFKMVYTGRLYEEARNIEPMLTALEQLQDSGLQLTHALRMYFIGEVQDSIRRRMESSVVGGIFRFVPWVAFRESLSWMISADCLLLIGNKSILQVPGKVYNYLASGRPILMTSENWDDPTAQLLRGDNASHIVDNTKPAITKEMMRILENGIGSDRKCAFLGKYSWEYIAKSLVNVINERVMGWTG